jgi:hypothetical protein
MEYNAEKMDFSKLRKVDEDSVDFKLFSLIDDIDTASDMFKPEQNAYYKYIMRKVEEAKRHIISDGYDLYYRKTLDKGEKEE